MKFFNANCLKHMAFNKKDKTEKRTKTKRDCYKCWRV